MDTRTGLNKTTWLTAMLIAGSLLAGTAQGKPGPLAQSPLFLGNKVPPNIFFAIDDSGSMNWEITLNAGTFSPGGRTDDYLDFTADNVTERRELCAGFNVLAYNPNFVYTPWKGEDEDGNTYQDLPIGGDLQKALFDPYDNDNKDNISNHYYFTWNDIDADGEYDGPGSISGGQAYDATDECNVPDNNAGIRVDSLPATLNPGDVGYPNSQRNYANWYSYYQKREYVAKRAISELIWNSDDYMGLATLHDNNNVGTPIADMNNNSDKIDLLDELGQVNSTGGTPLRVLMKNVGRYFDQAGSNSDHSALGFTDPSPILSQANGGECQQNFNILFSDGYWNGNDPGLGNEDGNANTAWDGGSHADSFQNTLADTAMYYYETDLSTSLLNGVPTIPGVDDNDAQHLVTYTVAFGVNGTLTANPPDRVNPFIWPKPVSNSATTVDDMRHAAWNARGEFLSARDPGTLISALEAAINSIGDREGSAAAVTFNSKSLQAGSRIFLSQFNTTGWKGDVLAYDLNITTGALNPTPAWSAQTLLDSRNLGLNPRKIYTYNNTDGVQFAWGNLTNYQKDDLRTNPDSTPSNDTVAQARLAFVAGDRSNEGAGMNFRTRTSLLGDIVHSSPQFVGAPELNYPDADPFGTASERYSTFKNSTTYQNRTKAIYAGSNDGMLHTFNANTGTELMTYIPNFLYDTNAAGGLHYLTDPNYAHTYYVDLTSSISDAYIKTAPTGTPSWRTVLVAGVRGGGRGLYALDITNPSTYTNSAADIAQNVLWEFDSTDDPDLGNTFSEPTVVMLNNDKWGVVFGNGYNNTGSGEAVVYMLLMEGSLDGTGTGIHGAWAQNTNYIKLPTGVGSTSNLNGMSTLTVVDLDDNGTADRLYGGDVEGNLWAFDISDSNPANWGSAYVDGSSNPEPLFKSQSNQPITVKPVVARLPNVGTTPQNAPNVMVYFGTGQYLTTTDNATTDTQSFYAVWDAGDGNLNKNDLLQQTLTQDATDPRARFISTTVQVNYSNNPVSGTDDYGWYFDLIDTGERVIIDAVVRGKLVFFATMVPANTTCSLGGGTGYLMAVTTENGLNPPSGAFDVNADGVIDSSDMLTGMTHAAGMEFSGVGIPAGLSFLGNKLYVTDTGSTSVTIVDVVDQNPNSTGRLSWQEMVIE